MFEFLAIRADFAFVYLLESYIQCLGRTVNLE